MSNKLDNEKVAKDAAEAMASLYTWATVVNILEGSRIGSTKGVITLAKKHQQRCLRAYDRAIERLG